MKKSKTFQLLCVNRSLYITFAFKSRTKKCFAKGRVILMYFRPSWCNKQHLQSLNCDILNFLILQTKIINYEINRLKEYINFRSGKWHTIHKILIRVFLLIIDSWLHIFLDWLWFDLYLWLSIVLNLSKLIISFCTTYCSHIQTNKYLK